jgi:hypothetical protein
MYKRTDSAPFFVDVCCQCTDNGTTWNPYAITVVDAVLKVIRTALPQLGYLQMALASNMPMTVLKNYQACSASIMRLAVVHDSS